jgi:acyl-CoA thioester hydrolase
MWRAAVGPWQEMVQDGFDFVVAETNLRFHAPARYDDELDLRVEVTRLGKTAMTTEIDVERAGEQLLAGWVRHVCVDTETWRKTSIPEHVLGGLERFAVDGATVR